MRLVGVALADQHARHERRGVVVGLGLRSRLEALEQLLELAVGAERLEVADRERGARGPATSVASGRR